MPHWLSCRCGQAVKSPLNRIWLSTAVLDTSMSRIVSNNQRSLSRTWPLPPLADYWILLVTDAPPLKDTPLVTWMSRHTMCFIWPSSSTIITIRGEPLTPITGFWQALIWKWIPRTQKMTWDWRNRRRNWHCTEWPHSWLLADVARLPKPMCNPEGISHSKEADDHHWIHFRHWRDHYSILVTLST
jgi:hypothetical protein